MTRIAIACVLLVTAGCAQAPRLSIEDWRPSIETPSGDRVTVRARAGGVLVTWRKRI